MDPKWYLSSQIGPKIKKSFTSEFQTFCMNLGVKREIVNSVVEEIRDRLSSSQLTPPEILYGSRDEYATKCVGLPITSAITLAFGFKI